MSKIIVGCCNLIATPQGFLLVQETKERDKGKWSFPQGRLEGDESIVAATVREAKEEAGLNVRVKSVVGIYQHVSKDDANIIDFVFESDITAGEPTTSAEHPEVRYFTFEEILELSEKGRLRRPVFTAVVEYRNGRRLDLSILTRLSR